MLGPRIRSLYRWFSILFHISLAIVTSGTHVNSHHVHGVHKQLPSSWHHDSDHKVHQLFPRGNGTFPEVGSKEWAAPFAPVADEKIKVEDIPKLWINALNVAIKAGKIPNIPRSHNIPQTNPVYPDGVDPYSPEVCSTTYKCRDPKDIWDTPAGSFAVAFDDGPLPESRKLIEFLTTNKLHATHFMIGITILQNPVDFVSALKAGNDIAVHTWNHGYMTTLSNEEIVAQLGWTMEIIRVSTGGRLARYWRPPYGDSDKRVNAIAQEVFGLTTVLWNQDPGDWNLKINKTTPAIAIDSMKKWLSGPKERGISVLEHESSDESVKLFMDVYPFIVSSGWKVESLATLVGDHRVYQNAQSTTSDDVVQQDIILGDPPTTEIPDPTTSKKATSTLDSGETPPSTSRLPTGTGLVATIPTGASANLAAPKDIWAATLALSIVSLMKFY